MRRIIAISHVTLDSIMQAPGGPEEDPRGGFTQGDWIMPFSDEALHKALSENTTNIYAEVDLQRKADMLVHSNPFSTTHTKHKRSKDDQSLLAFLRSL